MKAYAQALAIGLLLAGGLGAPRPALGQQSGWQWTATMGRAVSPNLLWEGAAAGALVATADGGAVVGGTYEDYVVVGSGPGDTLRGAGTLNGMLVRYGAAGQKQWAVSLRGAGVGFGFGKLALDGPQNLLCTVVHTASLTLPSGVVLPGEGTAWYRYSAATGTVLGAGEINRGNLDVRSLEVDANGSAVLTGGYVGQGTIGPYPVGQSTLSRSGVFITRFSPAGVPLWVRQMTSTGSGSHGMLGQAVLPNGDVLIGGAFQGNVTLDAAYQFVSNGALGFLACYNGSTGAVRWARTVSVGVQPLVDAASGQAYVAGEFTGTLNLDGLAPVAGGLDLFIARLNPATGLAQSLVFAGGGPGDQRIGQLIVNNGQFVLSGSGQGGATDFGPGLTLPATSPTSGVWYVLTIGAQTGPIRLYQSPVGGVALATDPGGDPFLLCNTRQQPVRFGQLPVITPRGRGEVVLAHVGLVLGTKAAGAAAARLAVYPNPAAPRGSVTVRCAWAPAQVRVHDVVGRQLWQGQLRGGQGTVPIGWPAGVYLLEVASGGQRATQRLLVE